MTKNRMNYAQLCSCKTYIHSFSKKAFIKILAFLKLLKMVYIKIIQSDESKYVTIFRRTDIYTYAISDDPKLQFRMKGCSYMVML